MSNPLVSISCITYNHAPYIRQCLDGFLMQECDFEYEILIHDDASTDGTSDIIREYQEKYPEIIKPIIQTENQWSQGVRGIMAKFNFSRAKGKYIALCEGDDYWTDPLKLQKQVSFLEEHPNVGCCFTNALVKNTIENSEYEYNINYKLSKGIIGNNIIFQKGGGIYPTCTLVYRKDMIENLNYIDGIAGDELLLFYLANRADVTYLNFISAVYNRWSGGAFSSIKNNLKYMVEYRKNEIIAYRKLLPLLNLENQKLLNKKIIKTAEYILKNDVFSFKNTSYISIVGIKRYLKYLLKL